MIRPVVRKMPNRRASSAPPSSVSWGVRKKKLIARADSRVVAKPGPSPPYMALIATAATNKKKTLDSISGLKSSITTSARALSPAANAYHRS
jgi:hypothetical protein